MQDLVSILNRIMGERGLSRADVAAGAKVSEATVSRILRGKTIGYGQARKRLFEFATTFDAATEGEPGTKKVVKAFNRIWDGSDERASAVAKIIVALGALCPDTRPKRGGQLEGRDKSTEEPPERSEE